VAAGLADSASQHPANEVREFQKLLVEFLTAFQKIPQKYCLLCKAKVRLGIEAHKPGCPLRRASNLIQAAQEKSKKAAAWYEPCNGFFGVVGTLEAAPLCPKLSREGTSKNHAVYVTKHPAPINSPLPAIELQSLF
jgi:hypothetical protein